MIKKHFIYAIAGGPGAGKTSYRELGLQNGILPAHAFVHDCDAVMEGLAGYQQQLKVDGPAAAFKAWELPARAIAEQELMRSIQLGQDIIYDRSCALASSYSLLKDLVVNQGYSLVMHLLYVNESEAIKRAKLREAQTGRHIPAAIIRERLKSLSALWPEYLQLAEAAYVLDNSGSAHTVIAEYKNNKLSVIHPEIYNEFVSLHATRDL